MRRNLIIVGADYRRSDHLDVVKSAQKGFKLFFLSAIANDGSPLAKPELGEIIFWSDFWAANQIVNSLNPKCIVFFDLENYNEILLNLSAKNKGITTYILDHGKRIYNNASVGESSKYGVKKRGTSFSQVRLSAKIKNKMFETLSKGKLRQDQKKFFKKYQEVRSKNSVFKTRQLINSEHRLPSAYISFSEGNFDFWKKADHLKDDHQVYFIGFPNYDKYYKESPKKHNLQPTNVIYIDQPFHEHMLLGWTPENKLAYVKSISEICRDNNIQLHFKPHPKSDLSLYCDLTKSNKLILIPSNKEFQVDAYDIVLGQGSTLDYPLIAQNHTVFISLDYHPQPIERSLCAELIKYGVCHSISNLEELRLAFNNLENIKISQQSHKQAFIKKWMYKFDGQAGERLNQVLLDS